MPLFQLGFNHKTAPIEVRDKLYMSSKRRKNFAEEIKSIDYLEEFFLLSTCNRLEIYFLGDIKKGRKFCLSKMENHSGISASELESYLYSHRDFAAVNHFFNVASGLDSMVIGESQILSQIKDQYEKSRKKGLTDTYLNRLCLGAIKVGKRVRNETSINKRAVSVSYSAVELAREIFGSLSGEKVMILGAGETSELTLKSLVDYGVEGVLVSNRTYSNGKRLAEKYGGEVIHWNRLTDYIEKVDIIIGSTGAPHSLLNKKDIEKAVIEKRGPMFLIDIAVPRDIDPDVAEIPGVHLYNIDDLKSVIDKNMELRKKEAENAEDIIEEEIDKFREWTRERKSVPLIKRMRKEADYIKSREVKRALHQLSESEDTPEEVVKELAHRLVNKLLHRPTVGLKEIAVKNDGKEKIELVKKLLTADN